MSPREHRALLRRDLQEGSYCAQFKTYHDEMKENEDMPRKPQSLQKKCWCGRVYYGERCKEGHEPSVTEAELARVLELDAKATQGPWRAYANGSIYAEEDDYKDKVAECHNPHRAILIAEYRTLTPRLARELAAARSAMGKLKAILAQRDNSYFFDMLKEWEEDFLDPQLNTHTHE